MNVLMRLRHTTMAKNTEFGVTAKVVPVTLTHHAFLIHNMNNNGTDVRSHWPHSSTTNMCPQWWAHIWRNSPPGAPEIVFPEWDGRPVKWKDKQTTQKHIACCHSDHCSRAIMGVNL